MEKEQIQRLVREFSGKIDRYDKPIIEKWNASFPEYPMTYSPIICILGFLFAYIVIVPILKKFICNIKNCFCLKKNYEEDMIYLHKYGNIDQYLPSTVNILKLFLFVLLEY